MKLIHLAVILLYFCTITAKHIDLTIGSGLSSYYESNILKLSDNDLDRFEEGLSKDKFKIESSDDLIYKFKSEVRLKHQLFFNHTQLLKFYFSGSVYNNNSMKNQNLLGFSLKQYFSTELNLDINYSYNPKIYVNRYQSAFYADENYHDYDYSKNNYSAKLNYSFKSYLGFSYKFAFSQSYYNKFFTEYDSDGFEHKTYIWYKYQSSRIDFSYTFKNLTCPGSEAYKKYDPQNFQAKDGSYEADKYEISFTQNFSLANLKPKLGIAYNYQKKLFQSNLVGDTYHSGREDKIQSMDFKLTCRLLKRLTGSVFYNYEFRKTGSPFKEVEQSKEYVNQMVGFGFNYSFSVENICL